jgi:hypothetical protein
MPYNAEISRTNPSAFLFLIDQSGSMEDPIAGSSRRKADSVADAINRILSGLAIKCSRNEGIHDYYEVGVIGYGAQVGSAFIGGLQGRNLVPISEVANTPARIEERTKKVDDGAGGLAEQTIKFPVWFEPVCHLGTPMCEAMRLAHQTLKEWVAQHPSSFPPIVINITDGESTDGNPTPFAQELANLSTANGNVLVFNCHISASNAPSVVFPDSEASLPDEYARLLFKMSSELPENLRSTARSEDFKIGDQARGFAFNADLEVLIRFLDIGTRPSNLR